MGNDSWMIKQQALMANSVEHCKDTCTAHESEILNVGLPMPHGAQLYIWI